ncbi:MAG: ABC transporter ATP-binding protein/permease [Opitutae bacterium]|nr:ABC transporter ATP-binding protein/permease [Opitutae bacterium]
MKKLRKILSRAKYYWHHVWGLKWYFFAAIVSGLIAAAASGLGIPLIIYKVFPAVFDPTTMPKPIFDFLSARVSPENLQNVILFTTCAALPLIFIIRGVAMLINAMTASYFGLRLLESIRLDVFVRLQVLPLEFHERARHGDLLSRIVADAQNVQTMITQVASDIIKQPLTAAFAIGALVGVLFDKAESSMFVASAVFACVAVAPIFVFGRRIVRRSREAQKNVGEMTAVVAENLASQREIRSYGMESEQVGRLTRASERYRREQLKMEKYQRTMSPLLEFLTVLVLVFVLVRGRMIDMTLTDFMTVAGALFFACDSIRRAGISFSRFKQAQASLERLEAILAAPDTMPDPPNPKELPATAGSVDFQGVSFSYGNGKEALEGINVSIPDGQIVALVGPSGAGKTTFASLVARLYDVQEGAVRVGGIDVRELRKSDLRRNISVVSQHAMLFKASIRENIRLGRADASDDDVAAAATAAALDSFLRTKPKGIDSPLGDAGKGVSGGQHMRIALARAFLKNAPILILDEATAALDANSEKLVQTNLEKLARGRTTLIVAHRFSSIKIAQRILVFQNGHIIGDGPHDKLYASCPLYKELYDKQHL